jgi:predicted SnoaL-like aldol condensation-catalyzing enzyme
LAESANPNKPNAILMSVIDGDAKREETKMSSNNKRHVTDLLKSIETGDSAPVAAIHPNKYIQHNLAVADGLAGFGEVMRHLPKGSARVNSVRVFSDGDYVVAHSEYDFFGPKAGFDIFRFENGKIVEHWDNLQPTVEETASGRSQTDGPSTIVDLDKTEANKSLVKDLVDKIFLGGQFEKITDYISTSQYDQHNPFVADGLQALSQAVGAMAAAGTPMVYTRNHLVLGEGNFVLAVSEGIFMGKHSSFYDLFRIEDGKIVEHWDTIEEIPLRAEWKNTNGKFGFPNNQGLKAMVIGRSFVAGFPGHAFKLDFHSESSMTWTALSGNQLSSDTMTVDIERTEIAPNVYLVTWGEPKLGVTVVHLQDYDKCQVWTNIVMTEGNQLLKMTGKLLPFIVV